MHDQHPSIWMISSFSVTEEPTTEKKCVEVLTPYAQAGIVEHREPLLAISCTTECSELAASQLGTTEGSKTVSVFDRGRTVLNIIWKWELLNPLKMLGLK